MKKELCLAIAILAIVGIVIYINRTYVIHNTGRILTVGVEFYQDANCTIKVNEINWGEVYPGFTYNRTLYCKNIRNLAVTLNLTVTNWQPENASLYLTAGWNYTDTVLQPGDVIPIQFELNVSSDVDEIENFSFDFNVTATSVP